jgi:hypothetical protein
MTPATAMIGMTYGSWSTGGIIWPPTVLTEPPLSLR